MTSEWNHGRVRNAFVDLEALVDDDPHEEDELEQEDWMAMDEETEQADSAAHRTHSLLAKAFQELEKNAERWEEFLARARVRGASRSAGDTDGPREGDALWEIGCQVGHEEVAILKILSRATHPTMPHVSAKASFAQPHLPGRIFVEVDDISTAKQLARDVAELDPSRIRIIPRECMTDLLRVRRSQTHEPQTWVRIRGISPGLEVYNNDIALVVGDDARGHMELWVVPRIGPAGTGEGRPAPLLGTREGHAFTRQGYMILKSLERSICHAATPTAEELERFRECEALEQATYARTLAMMQAALLEIHDRVRVVRGTFRGLLGSIISLGQSDADVHLPSLDLVETIPAWDLRKAFAVGDSVVAISGQHKGMKGWVINVCFGVATIMNMEAYREVSISLDHLQFHEEWEASTLKDLAGCSTLSKEDRRQMKRNPNQVYVGKRVMVVGRHAYKGAAGVVKDTTLRGEAMVELAIFNFNRHEKIPLGNLRMQHGHEWAPIPAGVVNNEDSGLPEPPFPAPTAPNTPFPAASIATPATPAWNPNSRSPLLEEELRQAPVPAWLADPQFGSHRVKLLELGTSSTRALEFRAAAQGAVTVRDGMTSRSIPLDDLRPILASRKEDTVVCTALGPHFAHVFRIKVYAADACIVRPFGAKAGKGEKLFNIETNSLAEIFPPQAAVLGVARP